MRLIVAAVHELVVTHGNGPQVGLAALQAAAYAGVPAYPLDVRGHAGRPGRH
jgi:carbamate kinase